MEILTKDLEQKEIYKMMISCIVPRPIAWVSTVSKDGIYNLAPFSYFSGISSEPPLISISVGKKDKYIKKDTLKNIEDTGEFVVNLVNKDLVEKMNITALPFDEEVDEFEKAGLTPTKSKVVKAPTVLESPVNIECKKYQIIQIGKMGLILGEIVSFNIDDKYINERGHLDAKKLKIVGRLGSNDYCYVDENNTFSLPKIKMDKL